MSKTIKLYLLIPTVLLSLIIGVGIGYCIGTPKQQTIDASMHFKERAEAQEKLNRLANDYDSACNNYQILYAAYDQLYTRAGVNSGIEKIARVDGARGNEDSCYR